MKQTTLAVSPAFIAKAHKVACSAWKTKLETLYPSVFVGSTNPEFIKRGDEISLRGITYMVCQISDNEYTLINKANGNRYANTTAKGFASPDEIPVSALKTMLNTSSLEGVVINGVAYVTAPKTLSVTRTLVASVEDIKDAYNSTADAAIKSMIMEYFPEAFKTANIQLLDALNGKITFSTSCTEIDGADFYIGNGMAPKGLELQTITCRQNQVEPEIIRTADGLVHVVFKKKSTI